MFTRTALVGFTLASLGAVATIAALPSASASGATRPAAADEASEIGRVVLDYGKAVGTSNLANVMTLYADDAVLAPPREPVKKGPAEVSKFYRDLFAMADVSLTFTIDNVSADGRLAYVISHSVGKLTFKNGTPPATGAGRELFVLRKTNGTWKITAYWFNT
jgi:ketosteroid isomerase-like protein